MDFLTWNLGSRRLLLGAGSLAVVVFGTLLCSNASAEELVPPASTLEAESSVPACSTGLRLRAVQFDPLRVRAEFREDDGHVHPVGVLGREHLAERGDDVQEHRLRPGE